MAQPNLDDLLKAGVHFGHQTRRWNPKMRRFIFAERNGIHIIDLQKTLRQIELAQKLAREVILRGDNVLFVCTKRQLSAIVKDEADILTAPGKPGSVDKGPKEKRGSRRVISTPQPALSAHFETELDW